MLFVGSFVVWKGSPLFVFSAFPYEHPLSLSCYTCRSILNKQENINLKEGCDWLDLLHPKWKGLILCISTWPFKLSGHCLTLQGSLAIFIHWLDWIKYPSQLTSYPSSWISNFGVQYVIKFYCSSYFIKIRLEGSTK